MSPFSVKSFFIGLGSVAASVISPCGLESTRRLAFQQGFSKYCPSTSTTMQPHNDSFNKETKSLPSLPNRPMAFILKSIAERISPSWDEFYGGKAFSLQRSIAKLESVLSNNSITNPQNLTSITSNLNTLHLDSIRDQSINGCKPINNVVASSCNDDSNVISSKSRANPNISEFDSISDVSFDSSRCNTINFLDNSNVDISSGSISNVSISDEFESKTMKDNGLFLTAMPTSSINPNIQSTHYYHAEMAFISALSEISERLCRIPKASRQKALQAELSLLNHNLPANICIPFLCRESLKGENASHSCILRICPTEAVVLNSAERVPFMILIEMESNFSCESSDSDISSDSCSVSSIGNSENEPSEEKQDIKYSTIQSPSSLDFYDRMRTAAILLAQLHQMTNAKNLNLSTISTIRSRIIKEMEVLDSQRIKSSMSQSFVSLDGSEFHNLDDDFTAQRKDIYAEDPSGIFCVYFNHFSHCVK